MITVAVKSPRTLERSAIRGHPPMETSPLPSATGNLHSARRSTAGAVVGVGVGVGVATGVGVGVTATVGLLTATPLSQTNFFPDLMQVKVLPDATDFAPALLHAAPALTAACAGTSGIAMARQSSVARAKCVLRIEEI